jgi:hypothetical protein
MTHLLQENGYFTTANIITVNIFIRRNFQLNGKLKPEGNIDMTDLTD